MNCDPHLGAATAILPLSTVINIIIVTKTPRAQSRLMLIALSTKCHYHVLHQWSVCNLPICKPKRNRFSSFVSVQKVYK